MITAYSIIQSYVVILAGKWAYKHLITYKIKLVDDNFSRKLLLWVELSLKKGMFKS